MATVAEKKQTKTTALAEGGEAESRTVGPLGRMDFVRYAGAGGDFNPIHTDEQFAKSARMPSVFGHGLLTAGILAGFVSNWLGRDNVRSYGFRLAGQVWPDDELTFSGRVERVYEEDGQQLAECSLEVKRQTGDVALTGTVTALVE